MATPAAVRVHPSVTPAVDDTVLRRLLVLRCCRGPDAVAELRRGVLLHQPARLELWREPPWRS
eukprot:2624691-Lingulodinium_polyedra.AAC.1